MGLFSSTITGEVMNYQKLSKKKKDIYKEVSSVHYWIRHNYGSADRCQGEDCRKISNKFDYALIDGKAYERKRENFLMLCKSCHRRYDWSTNKFPKQKKGFDKWRGYYASIHCKKMRTLSREQISEIISLCKSKKYSQEKIGKIYKVGQAVISRIINKKSYVDYQ